MMACSVVHHQMANRVGAPPHQTMAWASAPPEQEVRLSDLEWIGDLGRGGFAMVSKARHVGTGAVFALKMSVDPFVEDNEAAGSPHVVGCHATLRGPRGEPAYVLEFMDAGSLARVLSRRGGRGIPEAALAEVASHCVMGLAQLHSRGVAHLDVKPDNLLANARGEVKIADFNTSRILYGAAGEGLRVSVTTGTACYFSPERFALNARAGPRGAMAADVWGLGITVLELFLGRFAIPGLPHDSGMPDFFQKLREAICHREPPSVPEDAEASAELRGFAAACLQKKPGQRATVAQLLSHPFVTGRDARRRGIQVRATGPHRRNYVEC